MVQTEEQNMETEALPSRKNHRGVTLFSYKIWMTVYTVCYYTGIETAYILKGVAGLLASLLAPAGRLIAGAVIGAGRLIDSAARTLISTIVRAGRGYRFIWRSTRLAVKNAGFFPAVRVHFSLLKSAFRRNKKPVFTFLNYGVPMLASAVLVITVFFWSGVTFALEVEYGGRSVGYVSSESVYDQAADSVKSRILAPDGSSCLYTPKFSLKIVSPANMVDSAALSGALIQNTAELQEANGLFVNGELEAVSVDAAALQNSLEQYLSAYKTAEACERVAFADDVTVQSGLYPVSSISSGPELSARITPENLQLNVKVVRDITYEEPVSFETVTTEDSARLQNYKKVVQPGANGAAQVTAQVTYINGVETERRVIASEVTVEPVTCQIVVGTSTMSQAKTTKALAAPAGDGIATGSFAWPVARVARSYVSSYFGDGRGHKGWDIAAPTGTDIYAADGGTVVSMNSNGSGYGNHFVIDHGNGIKTLYAHCSAVNVQVGQKVTKGQKIAAVGSTGRSTGSHLHFEVIKNGTAVNPGPYLGK